MFPGQGSQRVGMSEDFFEGYACVRELFEMASDHLKLDFKKLLFQSDIQELSLTKNSQLAILLSSLAQYRVLRSEFKELEVQICAGLSLGEYTALVASEKMHIYDCLTLVKNRAESMHKACQETQGSMRAVIGLNEDEVCQCCDLVANINHPRQIVISGSINELDIAEANLLKKGAKKVIALKVSGAFHSKLMYSAYEHMQPLIDQSLIQSSQCLLAMNATGQIVQDVLEIKKLLKNQIVGIVRWVDCMKVLEKCVDGSPIIEVGVGRTLHGMSKKMGIENTFSFEKVGDLRVMENLLKGARYVTAG